LLLLMASVMWAIQQTCTGSKVGAVGVVVMVLGRGWCW
jgi:hypothetical protein